ncbi:MAG: 4-phosphoerythronate dehydrogenase [Bacteroidales bacterium]|nr:4-phosphoerythronate dehydrogenase [Bacteroidales bacterium]
MRDRHKIVIDSAIPFIEGVLEPYFDVEYRKGGEIDRSEVKEADALVIRTRTHCGASLLEGSEVGLIATATIGTDHIDTEYCKAHDIKVFNVPGCNSAAVKQYVFTALYTLAEAKNIDLKGKILGVIGVGNVGGKVASFAEESGFTVLRNDPPRERSEHLPAGYFTSLDELLDVSDIVTVHIPLWTENENFVGCEFLGKMKDGAIFINASRGEIVDEVALLQNMTRFKGTVIDVWQHEPYINRDLLDRADIATVHIAGYSQQGKINGTVAVVRELGDYFGIDALKRFDLKGSRVTLDLSSKSQSEVYRMLKGIYDIMKDDKALRAQPEEFEHLRENYKYRIEF